MNTKHLFVGKKLLTAVFVFLFTVFGIQSSYADYYPSGIQQNVSEQTLIDNGWTKFYEQTYATTHGGNASLLRPSGQYVILTGKAVGSSTLPVLAAAPTSQVFTETVINTPQLLNGTYWYNTPGYSIGFAPTNIIDQNHADISEANGWRTSPTDDTSYASPSSPLRLSWHIVDAFNGGWRLGDCGQRQTREIVLKGWPQLRRGNKAHVASAATTEMLLFTDGRMKTSGRNQTMIVP